MANQSIATLKIQKTGWRQLFLSGDSPQKLALASFFGIIIGTSPLLGFHFLIAVALAGALRLNLAVMYLFANISIPPLAPFIIFASIQIGHFVCFGGFMSLPSSWSDIEPLNWLGFWWLGSLVLGHLLGLVVAVLVFAVSRSLLQRRLRISGGDLLSYNESLLKLCHQLKRIRLGEAIHAFCKCSFDPVFEQLWVSVGIDAKICDLGGGRGYFLSMHSQRSHAPCSLVEWDPAKLKIARDILPARATIITADVRTWSVRDNFDVILMIDVLHYLKTPEQLDLIKSALARLKPNGKLMIRDMDPDRRLMVKFTAFFEFLCLRLGITRGERINPQPISEIARFITNQKFSVEVCDSSAGIGFANALLIATRK